MQDIKSRICALLLIAAFQIAKSSAQLAECLLPNCLACSDSPYICIDCPIDSECCQQQCAQCINQTQCIKCNPEFGLNNTTNLCQLSNPCSQFACAQCIDGQCTHCLDGFILNNHTYECIRCPQLCSACTLNGTCLTCAAEYFLNNQTCSPCNLNMANCIYCTNEWTCTQCALNYFFNVANGFCLRCSGLCQVCQQVSNGTLYAQVCLLCPNGTYLIKNGCKSCTSSCTNCFGSPNNCSQCKPSAFVLNGSCLQCFTVIPFCLTCTTNNSIVTCTACPAQMALVNNSCRYCPQNCLQCTNETVCTFCNMGYYLSNQQCLSCNVQSCHTCSTSGVCTICAAQYYLSGSNCLICPQNCIICKSSTNCTSCLNGYYQAQGICIPCSSNCAGCHNQVTVCTVCNIGFHVASTFLQSKCQPCPLFCLHCITQFICRLCSPGAYLISNVCYPCSDPNCYSCIYSNQTGTDYCKDCSSGYFLNAVFQTCSPCAANCSICASVSQCAVCQSGFYLSNTTCVPCTSNCEVCNSFNVCLECAVGFHRMLDYTACIQCPVGCVDCLSLIYCTQCRNGFFLSPSDTVSEYQLCELCQPPCLMCVSASVCALCAPRFALDSQAVCQPCPAGCLVCGTESKLTFSCEACEDGFALTYSHGDKYLSCSACPMNCVKCKSVLNNHTLTSTVVCVDCLAGWTMAVNGSCFLCGASAATSGCRECNAEAECVNCFPQYVLNSSSICHNNNYSTQVDSDWAYIAACIALGTIAMTLIIILLVMRLRQTSSPSSFNLNTSQISQI